MPTRGLAPWLAVALVPMVASQLARLQQTDPAAWVFFDYAGRLGALAVLFAVPAARQVAFRFEPLRIAWWEVALWCVAVALIDHYAGAWIRQTINAALPGTVLGRYPSTQGALHVIDIVFGLALVAWHEEIVFRRCAHDLCRPWLGDGAAIVAATSLLFGLYHWWERAWQRCPSRRDRRLADTALSPRRRAVAGRARALPHRHRRFRLGRATPY